MRALAATAAVIVAVACGLLLRAALDGEDGGRGGAAAGASALPAPAGGTTDFSPRDAAAAPDRGVSIVARGRTASVAIFRRPDAPQPARRIARRTVAGRRLPVVFLVLARRAGWVHVSLPVRPNGSRGWVRARDVRLAADPYRVEVRLRAHRLLVFERARVILRAPVGVGRSVSPTPTGRYFVADLLRPPDPGGFYGPYAFGLSAYSPVYTSFAGGDGQVGIHGTNAPSALGSDVSHGCIRVRNAVIARLARLLPLGTPVQIRS